MEFIKNREEKIKAIRFFLVYPTWKDEVGLEERKKAMEKIADDLNNIVLKWSDLYGESVKALNNISVQELRILFKEIMEKPATEWKKKAAAIE